MEIRVVINECFSSCGRMINRRAARCLHGPINIRNGSREQTAMSVVRHGCWLLAACWLQGTTATALTADGAGL